MSTNYRFSKAVEEGREKARAEKLKRLSEDPERQRKKKEGLESTNSLKNFRENTEHMHKTVLGDNTAE